MTAVMIEKTILFFLMMVSAQFENLGPTDYTRTYADNGGLYELRFSTQANGQTLIVGRYFSDGKTGQYSDYYSRMTFSRQGPKLTVYKITDGKGPDLFPRTSEELFEIVLDREKSVYLLPLSETALSFAGVESAYFKGAKVSRYSYYYDNEDEFSLSIDISDDDSNKSQIAALKLDSSEISFSIESVR